MTAIPGLVMSSTNTAAERLPAAYTYADGSTVAQRLEATFFSLVNEARVEQGVDPLTVPDMEETGDYIKMSFTDGASAVELKGADAAIRLDTKDVEGTGTTSVTPA